MEIVDTVESVPSPNTVPSTSRLKSSQTSFEKLTMELSLYLWLQIFDLKAWVWSDQTKDAPNKQPSECACICWGRLWEGEG